MRKINTAEVAANLVDINKMILRFGDRNLLDEEKLDVAKTLAVFVESFRRRYGITSAYYVTAEIKAQKKLDSEEEIWP